MGGCRRRNRQSMTRRTEQIVAIIPARGGSKRIPRKNIRLFCGHPIISYPIAAAQASGIFERIIVSTDSQDIADVARKYGAECPFRRPPNLCADSIPLRPVIRHAVKWVQSHNGPVKAVCIIMPTTPLLTGELLKEGYKVLTRKEASAVLGVTTFPHPVQRALGLSQNGYLVQMFPEHFHLNTNDLPDTYHDAAQFYWFRINARAWLSDKVPPPDAIPLAIPRIRALDIDTEEDWEFAEGVYRALHSVGPHSDKMSGMT